MTKAHREMENVGRTAGHGPYKCQECGKLFACSSVRSGILPADARPSRAPAGTFDAPAAPVLFRCARYFRNANQFAISPCASPSIAPTHSETRQKKEFSHRQLELPKAREMTCRHCNEHDKFEKKQERRRSLDEAHNKHKNNAEIHNKGAQVHQSTFHSAPVA